MIDYGWDAHLQAPKAKCCLFLFRKKRKCDFSVPFVYFSGGITHQSMDITEKLYFEI